MNDHNKMSIIYKKQPIELKLVQFVLSITNYRSSVSMLQLSAKKNGNIIWLVDIKLLVILSVMPKLLAIEASTCSLGTIGITRNQMLL